MNEIEELAKRFPSLNSQHLQLIADYVSAVRSEAEARANEQAEVAKRYMRYKAEAEARAAELEARAAQLREVLERVAYIKWQDEGGTYAKCRLCHAVDGHEAYCILSATPAQAAAYLSALEAEHEAVGVWMGYVEANDPWQSVNVGNKWAAVEAARKGGEQ